MSSETDDPRADEEPFDDHDDEPEVEADMSDDLDSPESIWADVDPVEQGKASREFERKELPDGRPVIAKDVSEGDIERFRDRVAARHRDISDSELGERTIMEALKQNYQTPSFDNLTYEEYKESKTNYYNQFVQPIFNTTEQPGNR